VPIVPRILPLLPEPAAAAGRALRFDQHPTDVAVSTSKAQRACKPALALSLLRDSRIKVNSADPGYTATDLNGHRGTQTIPEGAADAIRLALLPDHGPTGTYSASEGIVPW
jgi:hypothetical protein